MTQEVMATPLEAEAVDVEEGVEDTTPASASTAFTPTTMPSLACRQQRSQKSLCLSDKLSEHTIDLDGDGVISLAEISVARSKIKNMRRREFYLLGIVVLLIFGMFGTTILAIKITAELHVNDGVLTDNKNMIVATRNKVGLIEDVHAISARRRLNGTDAVDVEVDMPGRSEVPLEANVLMTIARKRLKLIAQGYAEGQIDWVVRLDDDTIRTVHILGADVAGGRAWGTCGTCVSTRKWMVACKMGGKPTPCPVYDWEAEQDVTRRSEVAEQLQERAGRSLEDEVEQESMERALSNKHCV